MLDRNEAHEAPNCFQETSLVDELSSTSPTEKPKNRSQAELITELGESKAKLWHCPEGNAYATVVLKSGAAMNLPVRGVAFRNWLGGEWYFQKKSVAAKDAMDRAIDSLSATAQYGCDRLETATRVSHTKDTVWIDLCDEKSQIVRVTPNGWEIVADAECPVRFLRTKQSKPLPIPKQDANLDALRKLLCVDEDGLKAIEAYALGAFMPPVGGFPILVITGEQGSGKSVGCECIRAVIDPAIPPLRQMPKNPNDLCAALNSSFLLAFDNISNMSKEMSDILCSLATGSGYAKRALYSDADEVVYKGSRPILISGINDVIYAPDLAERCIFVEFIRPPDAARRTAKDMNEILERERGNLLGAVLDRVSRALKEVDTIHRPSELPRLADFALWVYAGTPEDERGDIWRVLTENRKMKSLITIEDDLLASAVVTLAEKGGYSGTARELLKALGEQERIDKPRPEGWPATPDALGKKLKRLQSVLAEAGITVSQTRGKERIWIIRLKEAEQASQATEVSTGPPACGSYRGNLGAFGTDPTVL